MASVPRIVLVTRSTEYEQLLYRHGTRAQAAFFLESRDQSIEVIEAAHERVQQAVQAVESAIPTTVWRDQNCLTTVTLSRCPHADITDHA